jgi:hypothetical protein
MTLRVKTSTPRATPSPWWTGVRTRPRRPRVTPHPSLLPVRVEVDQEALGAVVTALTANGDRPMAACLEQLVARTGRAFAAERESRLARELTSLDSIQHVIESGWLTDSGRDR